MATDQSIKSGATACVCLLGARRLHVAWCGDSQLCLVKHRQVEFVTGTHKPNDDEERQRIEAAGGFVTNVGNTWRINDVLAVSRAFGDVAFAANGLVTCMPSTRIIELDGSEDFFIVGCDGLFEHVLMDDEFVQFVEECLATEQTQSNVAEALVNKAKSNGSTDNITAIFVKLK